MIYQANRNPHLSAVPDNPENKGLPDRGISLLVVDDETNFRKGILRLLRVSDTEHHYQLYEAGSAQEAMQMLNDYPVDCVLLDYQMPGTNGLLCLETLLKEHEHLAVIMITGRGDEGTAVSAMKHGAADYLVKGDITDLGPGQIIIGRELARYFGYDLGDELTLIAPGSGLSGSGWRYPFRVAGIFDTGMVDYDMNLVLMNLDQAQQLFHLSEEQVSGIGVRLRDPQQAKAVQKEIYRTMGYSYQVKTWIDINRNLFEALFLEKWGLFIILTLIVLVASFNIISTLIVTVSSKIHDIGILKSVGAPASAIRKIFTNMGLYIGSLGTLLGLCGGITVSYVLKTYIKVPEEIYSIEHVPVELQLSDILIILTAAMLISYLASIYPSAKAAQMQPVDALRYE